MTQFTNHSIRGAILNCVLVPFAGAGVARNVVGGGGRRNGQEEEEELQDLELERDDSETQLQSLPNGGARPSASARLV